MEIISTVLAVVAGVALYHFLEHLFYTLDARLEQKKMEKRIEEYNSYLKQLELAHKKKPVRKTR
jgi:uncharacterized membrane protein YciS (DUF1049 family)